MQESGFSVNITVNTSTEKQEDQEELLSSFTAKNFGNRQKFVDVKLSNNYDNDNYLDNHFNGVMQQKTMKKQQQNFDGQKISVKTDSKKASQKDKKQSTTKKSQDGGKKKSQNNAAEKSGQKQKAAVSKKQQESKNDDNLISEKNTKSIENGNDQQTGTVIVVKSSSPEKNNQVEEPEKKIAKKSKNFSTKITLKTNYIKSSQSSSQKNDENSKTDQSGSQNAETVKNNLQIDQQFPLNKDVEIEISNNNACIQTNNASIQNNPPKKMGYPPKKKGQVLIEPQIDENQRLIGESLNEINKEEDRLILLLEKVMKRKRELLNLQAIPMDSIPVISEHKLKMRRLQMEDSDSSEDSDYMVKGVSKGGKKRSRAWGDYDYNDHSSKKPKELKICHICHQQFNPLNMLHCTAMFGEKMCNFSFCPSCIANRHGEDFQQAKNSGCWVCPRCRGSCGPGCVNCCTCGECRKKLKLPIISQIFKRGEKRDPRFNNVHDELVFVTCGVDPELIKARKYNFPWGKFLYYNGDTNDNNDNNNINNNNNNIDNNNNDNQILLQKTIMGHQEVQSSSLEQNGNSLEDIGKSIIGSIDEVSAEK